jgi:NADPH:quinone reductase-like Zn-dependent oxidoreductase
MTTTTTMRALVQNAYADGEALDRALPVEDVPVPAPGPDDVLVAVRAAGVDRGAWHLVTGLPKGLRVATGLRRPRQRTPGLEAAGVVEAVGDRVAGLRVGDEVYGTVRGSFAQKALASPKSLHPKPSGLSFAEAAALAVTGVTAVLAVRAAGEGAVGPGCRVLVLGAGGGVGGLVVQLAKAAGAHVTGVCGADKAEHVRALGADEVVDRAVFDAGPVAARQDPPFDVVVDTAGNRTLRRLRRLLTPTGALVLVGGEGKGGPLGGFNRQLRALLVNPFVRQRLASLVSVTTTASLALVTERVDAGALRPVVDATFPLEHAADAVRRVGTGRVRGKVVLEL